MICRFQGRVRFRWFHRLLSSGCLLVYRSFFIFFINNNIKKLVGNRDCLHYGSVFYESTGEGVEKPTYLDLSRRQLSGEFVGDYGMLMVKCWIVSILLCILFEPIARFVTRVLRRVIRHLGLDWQLRHSSGDKPIEYKANALRSLHYLRLVIERYCKKMKIYIADKAWRWKRSFKRCLGMQNTVQGMDDVLGSISGPGLTGGVFT